MTAEQFTAAVTSNQTDDGVAQWFRHMARPHSQAELEEWNRMMLSRGPTTPEKQASFNKYRDAVDPFTNRPHQLGRSPGLGRRTDRATKSLTRRIGLSSPTSQMLLFPPDGRTKVDVFYVSS